MVKPLSFKGDKPKKRKRPAGEDRNERPTRSSDPFADSSASTAKKERALTTTTTTVAHEDSTEQAEDDTWVSADSADDISGPVVLVLSTSDPVTCLACDSQGKVFASDLENIIDGDPRTAEPHDVRQVWVANRVHGTESFSFKGHHGKYLSVDKIGLLSATPTAISPSESYTVVPVPETIGTFSLQTARDTFVSVEERKEGGVQLRADADGIGYPTHITVRMQARFKPKHKKQKADRAREKISRKELEDMVGRRLEEDEVRMLKRARKEGDFHERLLDVKVKGKHDKFA